MRWNLAIDDIAAVDCVLKLLLSSEDSTTPGITAQSLQGIDNDGAPNTIKANDGSSTTRSPSPAAHSQLDNLPHLQPHRSGSRLGAHWNTEQSASILPLSSGSNALNCSVVSASSA